MSETTVEWLPRRDAERVVESLRKGIPPVGAVRQFTVGREHELAELEATLKLPTEERGAGRLIRANYGSGKSHLLRVIREMALEAGFATSLVTMDAAAGVRGNRMDQVFGAVSRSIEVPGSDEKGIAALFNRYAGASGDGAAASTRSRISDGDDWGLSDYLRAPAMFVALRAWVTAPSAQRHDRVCDWLSFPDVYETAQKKVLYLDLVNFPGRPFRDPRSEREFYDGIFQFRRQGYQQSWAALRDLDEVAKAAGLQGLVLLVDEFEDVIQNLNNRDWQQTAFTNLFRFFKGESFPGIAYFAVTPEFSFKAKQELMRRGAYQFPVSEFDRLPHFEMSPITTQDLQVLARSIRAVYGTAYGLDPDELPNDAEMNRAVATLADRSSHDYTRQVIEGIVARLDDTVD